MQQKLNKKFIRYGKWILLSVVSGLLAGGAAAIFLILLNLATHFRDSHPEIIWLLPIAGFLIGWSYFHFGSTADKGNNLVIDEIHDPKKVLPLRMTPFVLFGTVITHLFGGSAGREGTAVQMGASLSDQLSKWFQIESEERKILLVAGAGAGFGAAVGAPISGIIFGMEVIAIRRLKIFAPLECAVASFTAFYTAVALGAPHSAYPQVAIPPVNFAILFWVALAGVCFGLVSQFFVVVTHFVESIQKRWITYPPLRPLIAGTILAFLFWKMNAYQYAGLGIPIIQKALVEQSTFDVPIWKIFFTALTIGSGFKGGEFIPLVFIGSTLGSALSHVIPISSGLLAALGFAAVFGSGANTPIACTVMAMEIFGPKIGIYALVACFAGYYASGHHGIYKTQRVEQHKWAKFKITYNWLGELPRRFIKSER